MAEDRAPQLPTPRQLQVLQLLSRGLTFRATACALKISHQTVKNMLINARARTGCQSTIQLVAEAIRRGWMS